MNETVVCPGCQAQLTLPSMHEGETVQCTRCRLVFEPNQLRSSSAVAALPRVIVKSSPSDTEDHELFEQPRRLVSCGRLYGEWFAFLPTLLLAAAAVAFSTWAYAEVEVLDLRGHGQAPFRDGRWSAHFRFVRQVESWVSLTSWPALLTFAIWLYLAAQNSRILRANGFTCSPAWVVGLFFIPVANVFMTYLNLNEIWRASDPHTIEHGDTWKNARTSWLIRLWGMNWLTAPLLIFIGFRLDSLGREFAAPASWLFMIANLNATVACVLSIAIIWAIRHRQCQCYIRLYEDPA